MLTFCVGSEPSRVESAKVIACPFVSCSISLLNLVAAELPCIVYTLSSAFNKNAYVFPSNKNVYVLPS